MKFYIDSANPDDITKVLNQVGDNVGNLNTFGGITTNPSAFSKIGVDTYAGMIDGLYDIVDVLQRGDIPPEIHVQIPVNQLTNGEVIDFIHALTRNFVYDNTVIKISPNFSLLRQLDITIPYGKRFNVTGLSSINYCTTVLNAASRVTYASLIPGRMAESGIDPDPHLATWKELAARHRTFGKYVIAGSMRTVQGVRDAAEAFMLPTIGKKVWDLMTPVDCIELCEQLCVEPGGDDNTVGYTSPSIHAESNQHTMILTNKFFSAMNVLGQPIYDSFVAKV